MSLRTPLKRMRGLGSAKEGTGHWWAQRLTAIALVPLSIWFVVSVITLVNADYATVAAWLQSPLAAIFMIAFIWVLAYHSQLGLQVVVEDYVHLEWLKISTLILLKFLHYFIAAVAIFAVLHTVFGD
ncbi:MAG: succinate dehydrogenase, hydrophobic membrane anchor protein [Gammaproteobacteria bacterium]|nr:succinate dehydrogenase, hydrophobic membrane anchor protein [Gammaproteobacteria bacterium]